MDEECPNLGNLVLHIGNELEELENGPLRLDLLDEINALIEIEDAELARESTGQADTASQADGPAARLLRLPAGS